MKYMKKLLALALAVMLVMSLATTASADTVNFTITAPATSHQYEIYQIFTGDLNEGVLSNIVWGKNGTGSEGAAVDSKTLSALEAVTGSTSNADKLAVITKYANHLNSDPVATVTNGSTASVPAGYYLIKDKDGSVTGNDVYTTYIVKIVGDVTITAKADVPEVEKKVKDTNDSDGTTTGWQDSADYDIGDTIKFQLTATLPTNYADYKTYNLVFTDTFKNMEQIAIKSVYLADASGIKVSDFASTDYTSNIETASFTVAFTNLKTSSIKGSIQNGYKVVVEYTAVLSTTATSGTNGNDNKVKLTYTNNPNYDGSGTPPTGETPEDKVVVFTYDLIVNKVDQDNNALVGAGFTLYKYDADATTEDNWVAVGEQITGAALSTFTWKGLDDGSYKLVETTTPAGYNTIAPIEFTISAKHDTDSQDPKLTELTTTFTGATTNLANGSITASVQNQKGTTLPTTGGIGTTIFYTLGSILVLAAVVLLVTKKRMASAK